MYITAVYITNTFKIYWFYYNFCKFLLANPVVTSQYVWKLTNYLDQQNRQCPALSLQFFHLQHNHGTADEYSFAQYVMLWSQSGKIADYKAMHINRPQSWLTINSRCTQTHPQWENTWDKTEERNCRRAKTSRHTQTTTIQHNHSNWALPTGKAHVYNNFLHFSMFNTINR